MKSNRAKLSIRFIVLMFFFYSSAGANTIYQHHFGGLNNVNLFGTAPDIRPSTETWSGSTGSFDADGSVDGDGPHGVWLPFVPETNTIYKLSGSIDLTSSVGGISLGFVVHNEDDHFGVNSVHSYGSAALTPPWAQFFKGEGLDDVSYHTPIAGTNDFIITLDATDAASINWTVKFNLNGTDVVSPSTAVDSGIWPGDADFSQIQYVGFSTYGNGAGEIGDFSLEVVPEPTVITLIALCAVNLIVVKRIVVK